VNRIERYLDQLIGGLNDMVERALQKHRLNPKTLDSNESTRKTDANWHQALEPGISIWGEQAIPPCPICGVNPHNWGIHEEWRHLPGAKSKEKLAAQTEKRTQRTRLQSDSRTTTIGRRGLSILLCKRPRFVFGFGDGCAREGAAPLPSPSDVEACDS
jgi:hypothetical protein